MRSLVVVGGGGHGRETIDIVAAINRDQPTWHLLGIADDGKVDAKLLAAHGLTHLGGHEVVSETKCAYVIGIGSVSARRSLDRLITREADAAVLVDPRSSVGTDVELAGGVIIAQGARVTTNVRIGRHSHLNVNAVVSHDCRVGRYVSLSPGVLVNGNVVIGDDVFIGTGAVLLPGVQVGDRATIGAGAVVNRDIAPGTTVAGVPARPLRERDARTSADAGADHVPVIG